MQVLGSLSPTGGPDLFGISVYGNPGDPEHTIIHISQSGLALPDEAYYHADQYEPIRQQYKLMVAKLLELADKYASNSSNSSNSSNAGTNSSSSFTSANNGSNTSTASSDTGTTNRESMFNGDTTQNADNTQSNSAFCISYYDDLAAKYLAVETKIADHHWDNVATRDSVKTYNPTDFQQLCEALADYNLKLWCQSWQAAYDATDAAKVQQVSIIDALQHVIVHEPSFLEGLNSFFAQADLDDLKLWARVHVLIHYSSLLSADFDKIHFDFYGTVLSGATKQRDRWKRAVSLVNGISGEDVGRVYVERHFPPEAKERMSQLVDNLIEAYRISISTSTWLSDETQVKALDKLNKFSPKIGYTNHWRNYDALHISDDQSLIENMRAASLYETGYQLSKVGQPIDKDEWLMNPHTVNAYYEPTMNVIVFPAAILQPPFFNLQADDAANYGGIGAVIGHEIGHGFDDQGSEYDGDGRLNNWWTDEDKERFKKRTQALIEQYNQFTPSQLLDKYADNPSNAPHVNGALTIGENIGDLGGVTIALKAYAFALQDSLGLAHNGSPESIAAALDQAPVIDGFTGLQRFFLSYASIWRTKMRDELAEQYLQIDPHSPSECRTNGIARNVDLFYKAFDVKPNDAMWLDPQSRVSIW